MFWNLLYIFWLFAPIWAFSNGMQLLASVLLFIFTKHCFAGLSFILLCSLYLLFCSFITCFAFLQWFNRSSWFWKMFHLSAKMLLLFWSWVGSSRFISCYNNHRRRADVSLEKPFGFYVKLLQKSRNIQSSSTEPLKTAKTYNLHHHSDFPLAFSLFNKSQQSHSPLIIPIVFSQKIHFFLVNTLCYWQFSVLYLQRGHSTHSL